MSDSTSSSVHGSPMRSSVSAATADRWQPGRVIKVIRSPTQGRLADLAGGRVRHRGDELDRGRALEPGQVALAVLEQLLGADLLAGDHERLDRLPGVRVRHAED